MIGFRYLHRHFVSFAFLGLAALACSSKATSNTGPASLGDMLGYANAVCERFQRCQPAFIKSYFADVGTCASRFASDFQAELGQPGVTVTGPQLDECEKQLAALGCEAKDSDLTACQFTGSLTAGAPCAANAQCATGACVHPVTLGTQSNCGTCAVRVPAGADCKAAACAGDLDCVNGVCTPHVALGGACNPDGAACIGTATCVQNKCTAPAGVGAPCDASAGGGCDPTQDLACTLTNLQSTTGTCQPSVYANLGQTCGIEQSGKITRCLGASCSRLPTGKCIPDLKEGAPCPDPSTPPSQDVDQADCEFPLACVGRLCTRLAQTKCQ